MTQAAQAGARRVIPLVAAGLGIAIAVMAFAPAATSPPPGVAVGVHEANFEVWGEDGNSLTYYFRVHTAVMLADAEEYGRVEAMLTADPPEYQKLEDHIKGVHWGKIPDARARGILEQIGQPAATGDTHFLKHRLDRAYRGVPGYFLHTFMDFRITKAQASNIQGHLDAERFQPIRGILQGITQGAKPLAVVAEVRRRPQQD